MSSRTKHRHKPRHHTHAVKADSIPKPENWHAVAEPTAPSSDAVASVKVKSASKEMAAT